VRHFERIDLLVNNAGIYIPKPFTEYTAEDFEAMISTNIAGYFYVTQLAVVQMRKTEVGNYLCFDCFASEVGSFGSRSLRFSESGTSLVAPDS